MSSPPVVSGVDGRRCRALNDKVLPVSKDGRPVIYWMSRDQRFEDNWALLYAQGLAKQQAAPLHVAFCLIPKFLDATLRHFDFMLRGLREVEVGLKAAGVPFHLLIGQASERVPELCNALGASVVVCDMSPLRVPAGWAKAVAAACGKKGLPVLQVDAHNVVPVWHTSDKQEFAARTIRKRVMDKLPEFLTELPKLQKHPHPPKRWPSAIDWKKTQDTLKVDCKVGPVECFTPGALAAKKRLEVFCKERLAIFADKRNDPQLNALSDLSPYYHFGQIGAQRCALRVRAAAAAAGTGADGKKMKKGCEAFIEESIVRRELSDNFCFYNDRYDSVEGAPNWAQITLQKHAKDKREYVYSSEELEKGKTHDNLWNASQLQMVREGKMHGFLRMYWAKKILEWSPSPKEALARALYLNDRYELDGRDPNGYVGCMWSICGVHDMGWAERKIFGKIRFMNYAGCKRKMDIPGFVARYPGAEDSVPEDMKATKRPAPKAKPASAKRARKG